MSITLKEDLFYGAFHKHDLYRCVVKIFLDKDSTELNEYLTWAKMRNIPELLKEVKTPIHHIRFGLDQGTYDDELLIITFKNLSNNPTECNQKITFTFSKQMQFEILNDFNVYTEFEKLLNL